jgi:hypothetical protein
MTLWEVQMANRAIVEMAKAETSWFKDTYDQYLSDQKDRYGKIWNMKGIGKTIFELSADGSQALEVLRNLTAGKEASGPLVYKDITTKTATSGSTAMSSDLFGLGAINYGGGWTYLLAEINKYDNPLPAVIVAAGLRVSNPGQSSGDYKWNAWSEKPAYAIAEGIIISKYDAAAKQIMEWRVARNRYIAARRKYSLFFDSWQDREKYRANRTKAIEEYYAAVANKLRSDAEKKENRDRRDALRRGAEAAKAEKEAARLKKEAEDALAAKATAEQVARDLQTALDNLRNAGSTADVAALTATIEQLKQDLVNAQNAAAEAARRANEMSTTSGGDTTGAAGVATDAATDATQTAADALAETGETVTFKTESKGMGVGALLVVGAVAAGGWWLWKRRQLRQIGP